MAKGRGGQPNWQRRPQPSAQEIARRRKEAERAREADRKNKLRRHVQQRENEVQLENRKLNASVAALRGFLRAGLNRSARIDLSEDLRQVEAEELNLGELGIPSPSPEWEHFAPKPPNALARAFGGEARYEQRLARARKAYAEARERAVERESDRQREVAEAKRRHAAAQEAAAAEVREHNLAVQHRMAGFSQRSRDEVEFYLKKVLTQTPLPPDFPRTAEVAFTPGEEQAVIRFELPPRSVIPDISSYRYIATQDEKRPVSRTRQEADDLYRNVISQVALLCVRDLFDSDPKLASIGFNGYVRSTTPGSDRAADPYVISLAAKRTSFPDDEALHTTEPDVCVTGLNAALSEHPYDLEPVIPLLNFDQR